MVVSGSEAEVGGLFHNVQTAVPFRITLHELVFFQLPTPIKTYNSATKSIVTATVKQKWSKEMDMRFYWMKDRVKQKTLLSLLETRKPKHGDYFMKHHPPHHHMEICATYLYMANALLKIDHKVVQE